MNWLKCLWWRWRTRRIRRLLEDPRFIAALSDVDCPELNVRELQRRYENGKP